MLSKFIVPAMAATNLLNGVEASSRHRHMHKRDLVYAATEVDVETVYETVTVYAGDEQEQTIAAVATATATQSFYAASHPSSSATTAATAATTSSYAVVAESATVVVPVSSSTTLATVVASDAAVAVEEPTSTTEAQTTAAPTTAYAAAADTTSAAAAATTTTAAQAASTGSSSSSGGKRGLGYNDASLVSTIVSAATTTFGWCYDWGFTNGGLTASVNYVPMLWGPTHYDATWDVAAAAAVLDGTEALFSFNECDNAGQANLDPATAATYHNQYFGDYSGKIKIGAPSITSSETTGQGLSWLSEFLTACGSSCPVDFINVHWYGPGGEEGGQEFLNYLIKANTQTGYNVWVTEFGVVSGDEDTFLTYVLDQLDTNSTLSFVDKYAYFYLATGYLFESATALSSAGVIYATS